MPLAVVAVIILIMKIAEWGPPATWPWLAVLAPFGVLFIWWEFIAPALGWEKRAAEKKMAAEMKAIEEVRRKQRGF